MLVLASLCESLLVCFYNIVSKNIAFKFGESIILFVARVQLKANAEALLANLMIEVGVTVWLVQWVWPHLTFLFLS